jgi:hypothetical protein
MPIYRNTTDSNTLIMECSCGQASHRMRIFRETHADSWLNEYVLEIGLDWRPLWQRIKIAVTYIFTGRRGRWVDVDEMCLCQFDIDELIEFLEECNDHKNNS